MQNSTLRVLFTAFTTALFLIACSDSNIVRNNGNSQKSKTFSSKIDSTKYPRLSNTDTINFTKSPTKSHHPCSPFISINSPSPGQTYTKNINNGIQINVDIIYGISAPSCWDFMPGNTQFSYTKQIHVNNNTVYDKQDFSYKPPFSSPPVFPTSNFDGTINIPSNEISYGNNSFTAAGATAVYLPGTTPTWIHGSQITIHIDEPITPPSISISGPDYVVMPSTGMTYTANINNVNSINSDYRWDGEYLTSDSDSCPSSSGGVSSGITTSSNTYVVGAQTPYYEAFCLQAEVDVTDSNGNNHTIHSLYFRTNLEPDSDSYPGYCNNNDCV